MTGTRAAGTSVVFQVFVVSQEPVSKVQRLTEELARAPSRDFLMDVLTGAQAAGDATIPDERVAVWHFPGESVFHLRSRIPTLAGDADWIVILEDHNLIYPGWPDDVTDALRGADPATSMLIGAATNQRSTDAWSWANFLSVLGFHWAPCIQTPLEPLSFNVAIRRDALPKGRFELGAYEALFVPRLMPGARPAPGFPVDHVQFRRFPEVIYYHWCNGRVTGAFMRQFADAGFGKVWSHAKNTSFQRQKRLRRVIRSHPGNHELPRYTCARLQLLAFAHSLGALHGGVRGTGRAPWALE